MAEHALTMLQDLGLTERTENVADQLREFDVLA